MDAASSSQQIQNFNDAARAGRPWWKACCIGCLLLIVAVFVGGSLILRMVVGPSNNIVRALPAGYPAELQPYRLSEATTIIYTPGKGRSTLVQILLTPAKLVANLVGSTSSTQAGTASGVSGAIDTYSKQLQGLDSVTIRWQNLQARREEVLVHYSQLFKQTGMTVQAFRNDTTDTDVVFAKRPDAAMQLRVTDTASPGVEAIELNVEYSINK